MTANMQSKQTAGLRGGTEGHSPSSYHRTTKLPDLTFGFMSVTFTPEKGQLINILLKSREGLSSQLPNNATFGDDSAISGWVWH